MIRALGIIAYLAGTCITFATWPPADPGATISYIIVAALGLCTIIAFMLPNTDHYDSEH